MDNYAAWCSWRSKKVEEYSGPEDLEKLDRGVLEAALGIDPNPEIDKMSLSVVPLTFIAKTLRALDEKENAFDAIDDFFKGELTVKDIQKMPSYHLRSKAHELTKGDGDPGSAEDLRQCLEQVWKAQWLTAKGAPVSASGSTIGGVKSLRALLTSIAQQEDTTAAIIFYRTLFDRVKEANRADIRAADIQDALAETRNHTNS